VVGKIHSEHRNNASPRPEPSSAPANVGNPIFSTTSLILVGFNIVESLLKTPFATLPLIVLSPEDEKGRAVSFRSIL